MNAPCHHCEERKLGCHSECERYQEFHGKMKKLYEIREKNFYTWRELK